MAKLIIFDLDGNLVHTDYSHREIVVGKTLAEFGKSSSRFFIDKFWFEGNREKLIKEVFEIEPPDFWSVYDKYDTVDMRKKYTRPYWDIDFLMKLKENHLLGVVTAAPQKISDLEIGMIEEKTMKGIFNQVVLAGKDNGFLPKPDSGAIEYCLHSLEVSRKDACFVGNADEDIYSAKNAKVMDVLMDRGEHDFNGLSAFVTISSLYALNHVANLNLPAPPGKFF